MESSAPIRIPSLANQLLEILTKRITSGAYPPESQLPPENQLAQEFGVSRATVRSALDRLEARGFLLRRQGVGTFVSPLLSIANPLNQFIDFPDLIASNGYQPDWKQLESKVCDATPHLQRLLQLEPRMKVLEIHKLFTADGEPVIYCINHIPTWILNKDVKPDQVIDHGLTEPFFEFFNKYCQVQPDHFVSSVRPEILAGCDLPPAFDNFNVDTPVLIVDQVGYASEHKPILRSIEYHPGNRMKFELIRRRGPFT